MTIQKFPYELLLNIFRQVAAFSDRRSIRECTLVCQSWFLPASRVLYEELDISYKSVLENVVRQKSNFNAFCKVLRINSVSGDALMQVDYLKPLLSELPNLETIEVNSGTQRIYILKQITRHAKLIPRVREIMLSEDRWGLGESRAYYHCIMAFKNTITNVKLVSLNQNIRSTSGTPGYIVSLISDFKSLTSLEVRNREGSNYPRLHQLSMLYILSSFPNLTTFLYETKFLNPDNVICDKACTHNKLRYLDITLHNLASHHIDYLIANIPHLKELKLDLGPKVKPTVVQSWMEAIGRDRLNRFEDYLRGIKKVEIIAHNIFKGGFVEFESFVSSIVPGENIKPLDVSVKFYEEKFMGRYELSGEQFAVKKYAEKVSLSFEVDSKDISFIDGLFLSSGLSTLGEDRIVSLYIYFALTYNSDLKKSYMLYLRNYLKVLARFQNIQDFTFDMRIGWRQIQVKATSKGDNGTHSIQIRDQVAVHSERLAYVTINNMESMNDIISVLNLLPDTTYLRLTGCQLEKDENFNYVLDLDLLHLQHLELDNMVELTKHNRQKAMLIKLEEKGSNRVLFFRRQMGDTMELTPIDCSYPTKYNRYISPYFQFVIIKYRSLKSVKLYDQPFAKGSTANVINL